MAFFGEQGQKRPILPDPQRPDGQIGPTPRPGVPPNPHNPAPPRYPSPLAPRPR